MLQMLVVAGNYLVLLELDMPVSSAFMVHVLSEYFEIHHFP